MDGFLFFGEEESVRNESGNEWSIDERVSWKTSLGGANRKKFGGFFLTTVFNRFLLIA